MAAPDDVPRSLRRWFVFHFWADMVFAVPLFVAPDWFLRLCGWDTVDRVTARLVAAALLGIGIQSLLGRNESAEAYRAMLNVKCIWSGAAVAGFVLSIAQGAPPLAYAFLGLFLGFTGVWNFYRIRMKQMARVAD